MTSRGALTFRTCRRQLWRDEFARGYVEPNITRCVGTRQADMPATRHIETKPSAPLIAGSIEAATTVRFGAKANGCTLPSGAV